jgi:predicted dehydrogenase
VNREKEKMDKIVRYGIIGTGNIGSNHAKTFLGGKIENAVLTAVCDTNSDKLKQFSDTPLLKFSDGKKLIDCGEVDAVIVSTPHYSHPDYSIYALNNGKHVMCEKPTGVYTRQIKEMNAAAEASGKVFTAMFCLRTKNIYKKVKETIAQGTIGRIKRINVIATNWYRPQCYYDSSTWRATWAGEGGGILLNQAPHTLDLLYFMTGLMPKRVFSRCYFGKWHTIEVEDDVTAFFEYENGATASLVFSTADAPGTDRIEILGDKGRVLLEGDKLKLSLLSVSEREYNATFRGGFGAPQSRDCEVEVEKDAMQIHAAVFQNMTNAILGKEDLFIDGKEGIYSCSMANAILLSTWLGRWIDMPFDDGLYYRELKKRINGSVKKESGDSILNIDASF